jgi:hypothetical protein
MKILILPLFIGLMLSVTLHKTKSIPKRGPTKEESLHILDSLIKSDFQSDTFVHINNQLEIAMGHLFDKKNTQAVVRETGWGWGCVFKIYQYPKQKWKAVFETDTINFYNEIHTNTPFFIQDYNFDGKLDFAIFHAYMTGNDVLNRLFLNRKNGYQFQYIPSFTFIKNPVLDAQNKQVYSFSDSRGSSYFYNEYKWFKGHLFNTKQLEVELHYDNIDTISQIFKTYKPPQRVDDESYQKPFIDSIVLKRVVYINGPEVLPPVWRERAKKRTDTDDFKQ